MDAHKTPMWRTLKVERLGGMSELALWLQMDLGITDTGDESPVNKNTRGGCMILSVCQPPYLECPPFSAKTILNASSRKLLQIVPSHHPRGCVPLSGGSGQCRAAEEKGGERTGPWATVSSAFS